MHATLQAIVEVSLSATPSEHLRLDHASRGTCGTRQRLDSKRELRHALNCFATSYASCGVFAAMLLGVGMPYCTEDVYTLLSGGAGRSEVPS